MTALRITADTTDRQIAVRAAAAYYPEGAPPALCERLVLHCEHLAPLRDGDPAAGQAMRQAREVFDRLTWKLALSIAAHVREMREARCEAPADPPSVTGRLPSGPNFQSIPVRTEEGRRIRRAFAAGEPEYRSPDEP